MLKDIYEWLKESNNVSPELKFTLGLREENQMNFLEKLKIHTSFYLQKARYD
jgi:hypothetical protein